MERKREAISEELHDEPSVDYDEDERPQRSNAAIVSFVLGIVAFLICWIPFVGFIGMPLSILGLILGIGSLIEVLVSNKRGAVFAFAGAIVSIVAILVPIGIYRGIVALPQAIHDAVNDSVPVFSDSLRRDHADTGWKHDSHEDGEADEITDPHQRSAFDSIYEDDLTTTTRPATTLPTVEQALHTNSPAPESIEEKKPAWVSAKDPIRTDDLEIRITSVKKGLVSVKTFTGDRANSNDPLLSIFVSVKNLTANRKLQYKTFAGPEFAIFTEGASLRDNVGNTYRQVSFDSLSVPEGRTKNASIYPGKTVTDVLVFEPPVEGIEYLELTIPMHSVGGKGSKVVRIPATMVDGQGR